MQRIVLATDEIEKAFRGSGGGIKKGEHVMNFKVTRKALSFILAVIMLMSATAVTLVNADAASGDTGTAPKAYDTAKDGEKLYDVDFSSEYYTLVDDSVISFDNGGKTYDTDGLLNADAKGLWRNNLTDDAAVVEEDGKAIRINDTVPGFGNPGDDVYIAPSTDEVLGAGSASVGYLNGFTLENKTYTLDFEFFKKVQAKATVFFGNGTFYEFGGCDVKMPNIGIEVGTTYALMRQNNKVTFPTNGLAPVFTAKKNGESTIDMKIVLSGGEVMEDVTLYANSWTTPNNNVSTWYGDIVPVSFDIYVSYATAQGHDYDIPVVSGMFYQPADLPIVFGVGESNNLAISQYYGVRDLAIYKGDTNVEYDMHFDEVYDSIDYGTDLFVFDTQGLRNQYRNAIGYQWTAVGSGLSIDQSNGLALNNREKKGEHGAYTPSPLGKAWDCGYYEIEMIINNLQSFKIGLISVGDDERIGFNMLPNATPESLENYTIDDKAYLSAEGNAATMWVSAGDGRGTGVINNDAIKTIVYDTFNAGSGAEPTDPRIVRDYGANRANVKIAYNCEKNIITLYEKVGGDWTPISAIDYNGAIKSGIEIKPVIDFTAYYKNSDVTIEGISFKKGMTASCLYFYRIDGFENSKVYADYQDNLINEMTAEYADTFGLNLSKLGWTEDGVNVIGDYKKHYENLYNLSYAPYEVKLAPVVSYDAKATDAVLRGVQFATTDEATGEYKVRFVAALGDVSEVSAIKFDIVKKVGDGEAVKSTVNVTKVSRGFIANGVFVSADLVGGDHIAAAALDKEVAHENVTVTYEVSVSTVAIDGTVTKGNTVTYTFLNGEYVVVK